MRVRNELVDPLLCSVYIVVGNIILLFMAVSWNDLASIHG